MSGYVFTLYVMGTGPRAQAAADNARRTCDHHLPGGYELQVIDLLSRPELAEELRIVAAPLLVRRHPGPERRILGDLADTRAVATALELPVPDQESPS